MYHKNNPINLILNIGIILYKFVNDKLYILLYQNKEGKYDLIYNKIINDVTIDELVVNRIYDVTNYLILLEEIDTINDLYDDTTFTLIKFIKLPQKYFYLVSKDFNYYEVITDDKKIKRELKWIEFKYSNNLIHKIKNMDITKTLNKIYKKNILYSTLNKIKLYK